MLRDLMPQGQCYLWRNDLLIMHVASDIVITLMYYAIPIVILLVVVRSKETIQYRNIYMLVVLFILACGTNHLLEIVNVWESRYYLSGVFKVATAVISVITVVSLIKVLPQTLGSLGNNQNENKPTGT